MLIVGCGLSGSNGWVVMCDGSGSVFVLLVVVGGCNVKPAKVRLRLC